MRAVLLRVLSSISLVSLGCTGVRLNGAVVSTCDEAGLRQALNEGGTVTFSCDGVITLASPLVIIRDTTLDANGHQVTLSGGDTVRLFEVPSGVTLGLLNLTLANGRATGPFNPTSDSGGRGQGGAVQVTEGTLWAADCRFVGNKAVGGQGREGNATVLIPPGTGGVGEGGAIFATSSSLRLTNCVFASNVVEGGRGGNAGGQVGVRFGGLGGSSRGGAICVTSGQVELREVTIESSRANRGVEGGGTQFSGDFPSTFGGAVYLEGTTGTCTRCSWRDNEAATAGGACFLQAGAIASVGCTFERNRVGGALLVQGGGIHSLSNRLELVSCSFRANTAQGSASFSIRAIGRPGGTAAGAAVSSIGGQVTVSNCAFVANLAQGGDGSFVGIPLFVLAAGSARGAGLFNDGAAMVINSTFAQNAARAGNSVFPDGSSASGGGVASVGGEARISFCTIANNRVSDTITNSANSGGAGCSLGNGSLVLASSILASNFANTAGHMNVPANAAGPLADGAYNLSSDGTPSYSAPSSHNNIDPKLGPLLDADHPTATLPLLAGSPAIDAADDVTCPATDQRGVTRPALRHCDIGAFEFVPDSFVFTSVSADAGSLILSGAGLPGRAFRLQASSDLSTWTDLDSGVVSPSGLFQIVTSLDVADRFYRTAAP